MAKTVLILDDSKTVREIIKLYLMGLGLTFLEAENGTRGLHLARLMPVDLVIADLKMPQMDGIAFLEALRADEREQLRALKVVLLTGERAEDLEERAMAAGATAFMRKPVQAAALQGLYYRLVEQPSP